MCRSAKNGFGLVRKSNASLTLVTEPRLVNRRMASFETDELSCATFGSYTVAGNRGTSSARVGKSE